VKVRFAPRALASIRYRHTWWRDVAVWRLLLRKTRHYLYYVRDDAADIATILLVDSAVAEADPEL
jgi:hypothetical protein